MPPRAIFVAATIDARLGGIARSVPALAVASATRTSGPHGGGPSRGGGMSSVSSIERSTCLIAPRAEADTLGGLDTSGIEVTLCDGFDGVKKKLEHAVSGFMPRSVSRGVKPLATEEDRGVNPLATEEDRGVNPLATFIYHAGIWNSLNHFVAKLGRQRDIPVIVSTRSMLDPWALQHKKWKKKLAWWIYAKRDLLSATAIHATAELEARHIREALGEKCPPVIVVPNGVGLPVESGFTPRHYNRGINPLATKRLLFLSRIHEKKGLLDLIRAFGELNPDGWELVIAGNDDPSAGSGQAPSAGSGQAGGYRQDCERLAREQPNAERIQFHGPVSDADKWDLYASADLFVLPSYSENFGIVVGEALGSGVPVITTTATPWGEYSRTETRRDGGTKLGLWVIETGIYNLIEALKETMALSDAERKVRAERGAEWIRREFTWEAIGRKFIEEVERVLTEND